MRLSLGTGNQMKQILKPKIAIIGAGQAGLQLAFGLIPHGYNVTLVTDRDANSILGGHMMSTQGMFNSALELERAIGIDFWQQIAPQNKSIIFTMVSAKNKKIEIQWEGRLSKPLQSVDQRVKFSYWLKELSKRGVKIRIETATSDTLESISNTHDLTIVAAGKGNLSRLFSRDPIRSVYTVPQRILSCLNVTGMELKPHDFSVRSTIIPGVGEYITMPGFSIFGYCEIMGFEGIPGGPFDCWHDLISPKQQLERAIALLKQYIPWEAKRCSNLRLADNKATLIGSYVPEVREPIHRLKSGKIIFGMADAVVLNDPIAGQGSNNASKCAQIYMQSIMENENNSFDAEWMSNTFEKYWEYAQWATAFSTLLLNPAEPHVIELSKAASNIPSLANMIANGFDDPSTLFPWITSKTDTLAMIKKFEINQCK